MMIYSGEKPYNDNNCTGVSLNLVNWWCTLLYTVGRNLCLQCYKRLSQSNDIKAHMKTQSYPYRSWLLSLVLHLCPSTSFSFPQRSQPNSLSTLCTSMCLLTHNSILNLLPQTSQPNGITAKWSALTVIQHVYPHIQLGKDFLCTDVTAKRPALTLSEHVFLEIFSSPWLFVAPSALMRSESKNADSTHEEGEWVWVME